MNIINFDSVKGLLRATPSPGKRHLIGHVSDYFSRLFSSQGNNYYLLASHPLTREQLNLIRGLDIAEPLKRREAFYLDPIKYFKGYTVDCLQPHIAPKVALISGSYYWKIAPPALEMVENKFNLKQIPMPPDLFQRYALGSPLFLQPTVLSTDYCNLACVQCPFQSGSDEFVFKQERRPRRFQHLSLSLLEKFLDGLPCKVHVRVSGFGEAMIHPELASIFAMIKRRGLSASLVTNGLPPNRSIWDGLADLGLDQICFSVDACSKEEYEAIRIKGDFNSLLENMAYCQELKGQGKSDWSLSINYSFLGRQIVSEAADRAAAFFTDYVDSIIFRTVFTEPYAQTCFRGKEDDLQHIPPYCFDILWGPLLGPDGAVFPCSPVANVSWFADLPWLGNLVEKSLAEILEQYRAMMVDPASPLRQTCCSRCTFWVHNYRIPGSETDAYFETRQLRPAS